MTDKEFGVFLPGATRDQTRAARTHKSSSGAQAPFPRTGQSFFQLTPTSHHAIQSKSSAQLEPSCQTSAIKSPKFRTMSQSVAAMRERESMLSSQSAKR